MGLLRTAAVAGAGLAAYSLWEPRRYRLVSRSVATRPGTPALSVLHVSDLHLDAGDGRLVGFLRSLPERLGVVPDLVLGTGDFIENDAAIEPVVEALGALEARLGRFYVLGSHDYYLPELHTVAKYFKARQGPIKAPRAATDELERGLRSKGWVALTNTTEIVDTRHGRIRVAGVDDPYIRRHSTAHIAREDGEVLAIGLVHAPDVVSEWFLAGFDLVVAGHTHGGQVRIPPFGAVVTNCNLPAQLAAGLHLIGGRWLHVSPGLGTGRFTPIRFCCPPEVTLLQLQPTEAGARL